jgi:starch synthase
MRVALLTREYPPEIYGGAGVHVEYLARELRRLVDLDVHCFGAPRPDATAHQADPALGEANPALRTLSVDVAMAAGIRGADLVHSHTWYANMGGHLARLVYGIPHVMSAHSLEPMRPWKAEQLGGGYSLSSWAERTAIEAADAVVAVSAGMRDDVLKTYPAVDPARVHVIHNGIDVAEYAPDPSTDVLQQFGIDPAVPYVLFVGRITRQKGVPYLVEAAQRFAPGTQIVLVAGSPDTPEIAEEVAALVAGLQAQRAGVVWLKHMLPKSELIQLIGHASVFVCPSIYEPLGIVNLEAMACETPVVATNTGGIPEVVADGVTGLLVPFDQGADGLPADRETFVADIASRVNAVLADPKLGARMGAAGRERVTSQFSWTRIAEETRDLYAQLLRA